MAASTIENQHHPPNCKDDPNFATVCSFLENFGDTCQIKFIPFDRLQTMLEDTNEVAPDLAQIHILLLRRIYKSINTEKWEKHLTKFCHSYNSQDAWEVERFGYKKSKIQTKLRLLKNLMESQFDYNIKFKNEVNKLTADALRRMPLGRDSEGQVYWYQVDAEANLRIYREDVDDDTWELVATSREEMTELIQQLANGVVHKNTVEVEGENGGEGEASPKENILLDTGTVSDDTSDESSSDEGAMAIDEDASVEEEQEEMEVDLKVDADKMNTAELGKAVRQMLDNSTSVDNSKMPEIERDDEEPAAITPRRQQGQGDFGLDKQEDTSEEKVIPEVVDETEYKISTPLQLESKEAIQDQVQPQVALPILETQEKELHTTVETLPAEFSKGGFQISEGIITGIMQPDGHFVRSQVETTLPVLEIQSNASEILMEGETNDSKSIPPDSDLRLKCEEISQEDSLQKEPSSLGLGAAELETVATSSENSIETLILLKKKKLEPLDQLEMEKEDVVVASDGTIESNSRDGQESRVVHKELLVLEGKEEAVESSNIESSDQERKVEESEVKTMEESPKFETIEEEIPKPDINAAEEHGTSDSTIGDAVTATEVKEEQVGPNPEYPVPEAIQEIPETVPVVEELIQKTTAWETGASDLSPPSNDGVRSPELQEQLRIPSPQQEPQKGVPSTETTEIDSPVNAEMEEEKKPEIYPAKVSLSSESGLAELEPMVTSSENSIETYTPLKEKLESLDQVEVEVQDVVVTCDETFESNSDDGQESHAVNKEPLVSELNVEATESSNIESGDQEIKIRESEVETMEESPKFEASEEGIPEQEINTVEEQHTPDSIIGHTVTATDTTEEKVRPEYPVPEAIDEMPEPIPMVAELIQETTACVTGESDQSVPTNSGEVPIPELPEELKIPSPKPQPQKDVPLTENKAPVHAGIEEEKKPEKYPGKASLSSGLGLVGYAYTSEEEEEEEESPLINPAAPIPPSLPSRDNTLEVTGTECTTEVHGKRRAESPPSLENPSKCSKMEDGAVSTSTELPTTEENGKFNPIVGETIEEEMVLIVGEGSGAELEGGNSPLEETASLNDTIEEDDSSMDESSPVLIKKGPGRPRGRKPGSGRTGRPSKRGGGSGGRKGKKPSSERDESSEASATSTPASVKKRVNGRLSAEIPTRQSSRIAKIQEKEEEERRRLEEERLAQLKAAQLKKQQRQVERDQKQAKESGETEAVPSKPRGKGRPPKSESKYLPTPSATESDDGELQTAIQKSKKRGRKRKLGEPPRTLMKKGLNPWIHSSSEDDDEAVEEEEEEHDLHEDDVEDLTLRSDHEFSPESDMGEDDDASPSRHARTVKRGETKEDKYADTMCSKCGKGDHPEWILLCDSCDIGWHASCLRPVTWVIPEGQWFCPPCQHKMLIEKLNENLEEYDKVVKKHELEVLRKQRLAFVGISLDNVLPQQEDVNGKAKKEKKHKKRRQISSDEDEEDELMAGGERDHFIDEREDSSNLSKYNSNSEDEEDEPMYKLRARKATKSFNFKEYDEMINSALRDEDEYEGVEAVGVETENKAHENGETEESEPPPPKLVMSKGKVMPGTSDGEEEEEPELKPEDSSENEEIDEGEKTRRQELEKQSHRKTRRRLNDLDATSDEDSDEDFKGSEDEDEDGDADSYVVEDEDSEWSGDRDGDESDDSIAKRGKKGKLGRQEKFLDVGSVRRSSRKARSRVIYDESDQEDGEGEPAGGWGSEEESEASTASESGDETWGKKKKKKKVAYNPPSKLRKSAFLLHSGEPKSKSKSKAAPKKKKKKVDEDETDRAWSKHGGKVKKGDTESSNKRSTRGKQIDFKGILESGESDDDGNIHPKRVRPQIPDYENDSEEPSSSKKLLAELNAAQALAAGKVKARKNSKPNNKKPPVSPSKKSPVSASPEKSPTKRKVKTVLSSNDDSASENEASSMLAEQLLKPIPAPPFPPVAAAKRLSTPVVLPSGISVPLPPDSKSRTPPPVSAPSPAAPPLIPQPLPLTAVSQPSTNLMMSEILASSGPKKQQNPPQQPLARHPTPPPSSPGLPSQVPNSPAPRAQLPAPQSSMIPGGGGPMMFPGKVTPPHRGLSSPPHQAHTLLPPSEISRVPNPAYYPPNQGMRFPWDRNLGPPPYQGRGPPPQAMVKPPPLNNSSYPPGGPPRSGYVPPPPLRIPNPGGSGPPLQSFQQFKREPPGVPGQQQMMYRMPPQGNGGGRGIPPPNILAHLQSSHERFFGPHGGFGGPPPYGMAPPPASLYSTTQPQHFDYRHEDSEFKEVSQPERRASPPPPASKEENKSDGEFGGLVSYFSSQRGEEDMDT